MRKFKQQFLAGPYLIWIIGFILLPLIMILYYAFTQTGNINVASCFPLTVNIGCKCRNNNFCIFMLGKNVIQRFSY